MAEMFPISSPSLYVLPERLHPQRSLSERLPPERTLPERLLPERTILERTLPGRACLERTLLLQERSNHTHFLKENVIQNRQRNELVPAETPGTSNNSEGYYFDLYQNALKSIETTPGQTSTTDDPPIPSYYDRVPSSTQLSGRLSDKRFVDGDAPLSAGSNSSTHFQYENINRWSHVPPEHDNSMFWAEDKFSTFGEATGPRHLMESQSMFLSTDYIMHQKEKWRRPRTVYTEKQLESLEKSYKINKYLRGKERKDLCKTLNLEERHVKVWYQNRRAKERSQIRHDKWLVKTKKHKKEKRLHSK